jgi:4-amino-4-deoxy-L-arabinose transferase-like glycosyltransferase
MAAGQNYNVRTFQKLLASNYYTIEIKLSQEVALVAAILALAFFVRLSAIQSNTLYVDEAIYIDAGRNYIAGDISQNELSYMFGSYLFPVTVALVDSPQSIVSLRIFSIALNLMTAVLIYLITRELFRLPAAFWSLLIFVFWGISMNLAIHAVHDALAIPLVIAALYCLIRATGMRERARLYGLLAGICFAMAVLATFSAVAAFAPLLLLFVTFTLYRHQRFSSAAFQTLALFCIITALVIGIYATLTWDITRQSILAFNVQQIADRQQILLGIASDIGIVALMAVFGIIALASNRSGDFRTQASFKGWNVALTIGVIVSNFMPQLYHLISGNARSLWQHNTLTLALLAPFAGYALTVVAGWFESDEKNRGTTKPLRWLVYASIIVIVIFAAQANLGVFNIFQRSWPNVSENVAFLRSARDAGALNFESEGLVLASAAPTYQYYLFPGERPSTRWWTTWFFTYDGASGLEAMTTAAQDCAFDLVILDNYFSSDVSAPLGEALLAAGYEVAFTSDETLSYGAVIESRIFEPGNSGQCAEREEAL